MKKIRTLIVDDSLLFREALAKGIGKDPQIEVVGTAINAFEARDKILQLHPDVITLDIEMPRMNGIDFLKQLIPKFPIPVVVVTATPLNAFDALSAGAVDFVKKPEVRSDQDLTNFISDLSAKVRIASHAHVRTGGRAGTAVATPSRPLTQLNSTLTRDKIIAIGASTGGTEAILKVVQDLPPSIPGIVVVQHMPANFTRMYAQRLDGICKIEVKEAKTGDRVQPGRALIAPGEFQMTLGKDAKGYFVKCLPGAKVSGHCPSVDVLFNSVAEQAKANAIGVILTGMGADGAQGLLKMKKAGAFTIGQDKNSCVVYGMPMVAYNVGAVTKQVPLSGIPSTIISCLNLR